MVIQHNLMAMNADRQLGITTKSVASSTEKLTSGYQINRAADNAAGLAISEKMRKQIRGLSRASENSEDGISCTQTAEGALAEVQDMLQRMNELCVQAANGTNSTTDRQYIQDEIDQLISEVDRVSETTKFNDTYLLKGDEQKSGKLTYMVDYSVTYTKNNVSNAQSEKALPYKVNYTGNYNIYMVSNDVFTLASGMKITADKIKQGQDITDYMIQAPYRGNTQATLNVSEYASFVNAELNSKVLEGEKGLVNSQLTTSTSVTRYEYDLSNNGIDSTIRANRDLFVYDTTTSNIIRLNAGTEMTDYLNEDQTMNDRYRLVDVLSAAKGYVDELNGVAGAAGTTNTATVVRYAGRSGTVYYVDEADATNITTMYLKQGQDISSLYYEDSTKNWAYADTGIDMGDLAIKVLGLQITYDEAFPKPYWYYCKIGNGATASQYIASYTGGSTSYKFTDLSGVGHRFRTQQLDAYYKGNLHNVVPANAYIGVEDITSGSTRAINGGTFSWDDSVLALDISSQRLYDANGKEVSGMALHKYFDKNGKYTGGLFTTSQARIFDEVFASKDSQGYQNMVAAGRTPALITSYITMNTQKINVDLDIMIHAGADSNLSNKVGIQINTMSAAGIGVDKMASKNIGIVDETGLKATDAIDVVADAITVISRQRALLGAVQNRLEHTIKNLDNVVENTQKAESTIRDTDMAEEMVQYSNQNILQQAGQSMLVQANQKNQGMLNLIR